MIKAWSDDAWADYLYWFSQGDKKKIGKINKLLGDIDRHPYSGIGKPESLKYGLANKCSRRITNEHRLIYSIEKQQINIYSVRSHYR